MRRNPKIGSTVLGYWQESQAYYLGTVAEKKGTDFVVVFDDGDIATLPADKIRENNLKVGSKVTAPLGGWQCLRRHHLQSGWQGILH